MGAEHSFDLGRVDVDAAADDQVLGPTGELDMARRKDTREIAREMPAVGAGEGSAVGVDMQPRHARPAIAQPSDLALGHDRAGLVHDLDFDPEGRPAHRVGEAKLLVRGQDGDAAGLAGPVVVDEAGREAFDDLAALVRRDRRAGGDQQPYAGQRQPVAVPFVDQTPDLCRHQEHRR